MKNTFRKTLLASLVVPFALAAASASAAPISSWGYTINNDFSDANYTEGGGSQDSGTQMLSWGSAIDSTERSSISFTDVDSANDQPVPDTLITNGNSVAGGVFTHNNTTIGSEFATLESFVLTSTLTLDPTVPNGISALRFESFFTETPNSPGSNGCAYGETPCGDIFTLGNPEGLGFVSDGEGGFELAQSFNIDGHDYTAYLKLAGLIRLDNTECGTTTDGVVIAPCYGLLTPEDQTTEFNTTIRITGPVEVPEPGTLALLGMGLAGLGMSRRRKAAKA